MALQYCPSCKRNVNTEYRLKGVVLILLLIFFIIPGIIYLVWGLTGKRCPICHTPGKMLEPPRFEE